MSNSKPLKNGHDKPKTPSQSPGAIRMRRYRERRLRGAIVIQNLVIEPDLVAILAANGWLHESEMRSREAVEHALHGITFAALGWYAAFPHESNASD